MNRNRSEATCLQPAALVRTEAAALEALAARLEGPMAADFDARGGADSALRRGQRPRGGDRHGQERHHRAEDCGDAQLDRIAGAVSASGRGGARRPGRADAGRRGDCALGERRDGGDSAAAGDAEAQGRRAGELLLQSELDAGDGERCGAGLRRGARGLRAESGADGVAPRRCWRWAMRWRLR